MVNSNTRIYIANLGKYNEGYLVGEWIDLPFSEEELNNLFVKIGLGYIDKDGDYIHGLEVDGVIYEEYAIHDYETDINGLKISEYENLEELNETIKTYENLSEWEAETAAAAVEYFGYDLKDVIERIDEFNLYPDVNDEYDLGYYWAVESGCYEIDDKNPLMRYIDFKAFGRDINLETSGGFTSKGYIEELG